MLYGKLVSSFTKWVTVLAENNPVFSYTIPTLLASSRCHRVIVEQMKDAVKYLDDHMKKVKFLSFEFSEQEGPYKPTWSIF